MFNIQYDIPNFKSNLPARTLLGVYWTHRWALETAADVVVKKAQKVAAAFVVGMVAAAAFVVVLVAAAAFVAGMVAAAAFAVGMIAAAAFVAEMVAVAAGPGTVAAVYRGKSCTSHWVAQKTVVVAAAGKGYIQRTDGTW